MDPSRMRRLVPFVTTPDNLVAFGARDGIKEAMLVDEATESTVRLHLDDTLSGSDGEGEENVTIQQLSDDDAQSQERWIKLLVMRLQKGHLYEVQSSLYLSVYSKQFT